MGNLQVRDVRQDVAAERHGRTRNQSARPATGPAGQHVAGCGARQHESHEPDEVVDENDRGSQPQEGHREQALGDQVFRKGQGVWLRVEDVGIEQGQGLHDDGVRDPGQRPLVQHRIRVVVPAPRAGSQDERPGMDEGKGRERAHCDDKAAACTHRGVALLGSLTLSRLRAGHKGGAGQSSGGGAGRKKARDDVRPGPLVRSADR